MTDQLKARIAAEREAMNLAPWMFAPIEAQDAPNPYSPGCAGYESWNVAAEQWRELQRRRTPPPERNPT